VEKALLVDILWKILDLSPPEDLRRPSDNHDGEYV
jgi:hypothetical protein